MHICNGIYAFTSESILCDYYYNMYPDSWLSFHHSPFNQACFDRNCPNPNGTTKKFRRKKNSQLISTIFGQFSQKFKTRRIEWRKKTAPYLCHLPRQSPNKKFNFAIKHYFSCLSICQSIWWWMDRMAYRIDGRMDGWIELNCQIHGTIYSVHNEPLEIKCIVHFDYKFNMNKNTWTNVDDWTMINIMHDLFSL